MTGYKYVYKLVVAHLLEDYKVILRSPEQSITDVWSSGFYYASAKSEKNALDLCLVTINTRNIK